MFVVKLVVPIVPNFVFLWWRIMSLSRSARTGEQELSLDVSQLRVVPMHSSSKIIVLVYGLVG
jgi:hypothetical protein